MRSGSCLGRVVFAGLCACVAVGAALQAAPIPGLFSTGVDDTGAVLPAAAVDPHYTLVTSPDAGAPGPAAYTLTSGFPVPPWVAEGPDSRWIAPQANQGTGNAPGDYTYRTTFDLTGYDPATAQIAGQWTSDNMGVDIVLNGNWLGISQPGNFGALTDFQIDWGFVEGVNTLEFIVNNAGEAANPTGLRVQLYGTVIIAGEAPYIIAQPQGAVVLAGDDVRFEVIADGTPPLQYQWKRNGTNVPGATDSFLEFFAVSSAEAGEYTVVITNGVGSETSDPAVLDVYEPIPGLFNTGVDDDGIPLFDYDIDPHYILTVNPDSEFPDCWVQDSFLFPIVAGPWIANGFWSVWIGPRGETSGAAGGDYVYQLTIDLTGLDPTKAFISGRWTTDNAASMWLNGAATGVTCSGNFDTLNAFRIDAGFLSGVNTLEFRVNNAGAGYTGLRVEDIRGGAAKKTGPGEERPRIVAEPPDQTVFVGDLVKLTVLADGTKPFTYQWQFGGADLPGQTSDTLELANIQLAQEGVYTVVVRNSLGTATADASLLVLVGVPGVFNTGVDDQGVVLADGSVDPHYALVTNVHNPGVPDAIVEDHAIWPIVTGPWVMPNELSKWIGPVLDTNGAVGDYVYRTTFDMTGFDPETAVLLGGWATDNQGTDLLLNGVSTGLRNDAQFGSFTRFEIQSGFLPGLNTLEFRVNNADGPGPGPTGLRVEGLRVGTKPGVVVPPPDLEISLAGAGVKLAWPAAATGYTLVRAGSLPAASWDPVAEPVVVEGDKNTVTVPATAAATFFRLEK